MCDGSGQEVWSATLDGYGDVRDVRGDRSACPFRWPGQYEDAETGLYYNRYRYYDPESGEYLAADPIRLQGGLNLFAYVGDPAAAFDPLGLAACGPTDTIVLGEGMDRVKNAVHDLQGAGASARWYQAWKKNFPAGRMMTPAELDAAIARNERWLVEKIKSGVTIYDIGPQAGRATPSPFYAAEQAVLAKLGIVPIPLPGY
jgi:RHS repeat-associated protein